MQAQVKGRSSGYPAGKALRQYLKAHGSMPNVSDTEAAASKNRGGTSLDSMADLGAEECNGIAAVSRDKACECNVRHQMAEGSSSQGPQLQILMSVRVKAVPLHPQEHKIEQPLFLAGSVLALSTLNKGNRFAGPSGCRPAVKQCLVAGSSESPVMVAFGAIQPGKQ